jgi:dihydrofolate reductase
MVFDIIAAAHYTNNAIGKEGKLLWNNSTDMRYFREITTKTTDPKKINAVIMGRKTYDSIGFGLKKRVNLILTHNPKAFKSIEKEDANLLFHDNFEEALQMLYNQPTIETIFVIGGESIYKMALDHPNCRRIYLNMMSVDCDVSDADAFFPPIDATKYKIIQSNPIHPDVINTIYYRVKK